MTEAATTPLSVVGEALRCSCALSHGRTRGKGSARHAHRVADHQRRAPAIELQPGLEIHSRRRVIAARPPARCWLGAREMQAEAPIRTTGISTDLCATKAVIRQWKEVSTS